MDLINFSSLVNEDEWKLHLHSNLIRINEMKLISRQNFQILTRRRTQTCNLNMSSSIWASIKKYFREELLEKITNI